MRRLAPFFALFMALLIAPLTFRSQVPVADAAQPPPPSLSQMTVLPDYTEQRDNGTSTNDIIANAEAIGTSDAFSWQQTITGTLGTATDLDYYQLRLLRPASRISLTLDGLPADYDLVLGGGSDPTQTTTTTFQSGLEGITQVGGTINSIGGTINSIGGTINSIGGTINSIGGTINSIGGTINSIGGTINSIGGTINSISTHSGTISETIDTQLWLPGTYYVVVTTNNGAYSATPYRLSIALSDSGLGQPPPTPDVALTLNPNNLAAPAAAITTLYIYNSTRMEQVYGLPLIDPSLISITVSLDRLANLSPITLGAPAEKGVVIDLAALQPVVTGTQTISDVYALWDANQVNPLYANYVAGLIDKVIEAATSDGVSGPGTTVQAASFYAGVRGQAPSAFPNLRNVVLVGGDAVLPFYRIPDLTTIANEAEYAAYLATRNANGIIDPASAQGAALRHGMLLTDNPYGAGRPYRFYGSPFYLPHLAVGRIVESPAEIARYLAFYGGATPDFTIDVTTGLQKPPRRAFVSGYDFLQDEAERVASILYATGLTTNTLNFLNDDTWQRPAIEQAWFDGRLTTDFPAPGAGLISGTAQIELSSVNAHFDHWQLLPALGTAGNFTAERLLTPAYPAASPLPYFGGTLGYSVGCHSGYNVADGAVPVMPERTFYQADFPQAQNAHGGNWVGNTGYGYGTADGVDYSERLAVLYTEELARKVLDSTGTSSIGATIGDALLNAKQRYVRNAVSLGAYDYKVVNIMTLYGLPFLRTKFMRPLAPPPEDPSPQPGSAPVATRAPQLPNALSGRLTRTITFTVGLTDTNFVAVPRTGSSAVHVQPTDFQIEDEFIDRGFGTLTNPLDFLRLTEDSQIGAPTLPAFAYDIGALSNVLTTSVRLKVRDVVFLHGAYMTKAAFDPQITQIITDTSTPVLSTTAEPNFAVGAGVWYPSQFFSFSSVGENEQQRDQLTAFGAQFQANTDGMAGQLRAYTQLVFQVTYEDPTVNTPQSIALNADTTAPIIQSVTVRSTLAGPNLAATDKALIEVEASDGTGVSGDLDVSAVYAASGETWLPVHFTKGLTGKYTVTLPVRPRHARFVVRVTDSAGNSSYYTSKGRLTPQSTLALPMLMR